MSDPVLVASGLGKTYPLPKGELRVFEGLDFELERGELAAVMGASGVGKTTLLNLLGGLDRPTEGRITLDGEDLFDGTDTEVASVRNRKIGFPRAAELLREVGLEDKTASRPSQLSGGEQQRVAIARALANGPCLLLADEPTGNLDWKTGEKVLRLVLDLHERRGLSSILVTHNEKI